MTKTIDHADLLIPPGTSIRLGDYDPAFTSHISDKAHALERLAADIDQLAAVQDALYADRRFALLVVFQGMDAAGKDGAIRHVMSGVSPQGVDVYAFKQPSAEELSHDYLWRCARVLPERGRIALFNRSYYEEVLVVRVHQSALGLEGLPPRPSSLGLWQERFEDIVAFERHLVRNGTLVIKFFLNVSREEQRLRLLERIDAPNKNWKISAGDIRERAFWDQYRQAYEELLSNTSTAEAPWYIIPADHKWFTRTAVADVIVKRLSTLGLTYPSPSPRERTELAAVRKRLLAENATAVPLVHA